MKLLEKFVLLIYSIFMLALAIIACLIVFKILDFNMIVNTIKDILADESSVVILLSVSIICILLSIRCIFFRFHKEIKKSTTTDVLLENESGKLLISKKAIENAVKNILNNDDIESRINVDIDPANNLSIYVSVIIEKDMNIKELIVGLQEKIKETIKNNFDLTVKEVNIKVDSNENINKNMKPDNSKKNKNENIKVVKEENTDK